MGGGVQLTLAALFFVLTTSSPLNLQPLLPITSYALNGSSVALTCFQQGIFRFTVKLTQFNCKHLSLNLYSSLLKGYLFTMEHR